MVSGDETTQDRSTSFSHIGVIPELQTTLENLGWSEPTPIQQAAIPIALSGKDVIGIAETGSGKTGAFLIPFIQHWIRAGRPKAFGLILAPTRELAQQLTSEAVRLGSSAVADDSLQVVRLTGGEDAVNQALQLAWSRHHLLVATPGRLIDHMKQSSKFASQQLSRVRHLILDEADRMLNMAFAEDIDMVLDLFQRPATAARKKRKKAKRLTILEQTAQAKGIPLSGMNPHRPSALSSTEKFPHPQTQLYSATMTKDVAKLRRAALSSDAVSVNCLSTATSTADEHSCRPDQLVVIRTAREAAAAGQRSAKTGFPARLSHYFLPLRLTDKPALLDWIVEQDLSMVRGPKALPAINCGVGKYSHRCIVFCKRCREARLLSGFLCERGHRAVCLQGRMKHADRKQALSQFSTDQAQILVATDVAARGLDLPNVDLVVNFSVPLSEKTYRHRVGRTARAGQAGIAVTLVSRDVAHSFLELEAAITPHLPVNDVFPDEGQSSIPKWPVPLPNASAMLARRRMVDVAWSRASKVIRMEDAERRKLADSSGALGHDSATSDFDEDEIVDAFSSDAEESVEEEEEVKSGTHAVPLDDAAAEKTTDFALSTSGQAGIEAARNTWKSLVRAKRHQRQKRQILEDQLRATALEGWGLKALSANDDGPMAVGDCGVDNDDSDTERDHLRFDETLRQKYVTTATSGTKKRAKHN